MVNKLLEDMKKYFVPEKRFELPSLRSMTMVGYMESGKTTFTKALYGKVERFAEEKNLTLIFVVAKSFLSSLEWFKREKPGADIIVLFVDDVLRDVISWERNKEATSIYKEYSTIRHFFYSLGYRYTILNVVFAGQRWTLIPPFLRNCPIISIKSLPSHDRRELLEVSRNFGRGVIKVLRELTYRIYVEQNEDAIFTAVTKPMWEPNSFLLTLQRPREFPKNIAVADIEEESVDEKAERSSVTLEDILRIQDPNAVIVTDTEILITSDIKAYVDLSLNDLAQMLGGYVSSRKINGRYRKVVVIPRSKIENFDRVLRKLLA